MKIPTELMHRGLVSLTREEMTLRGGMPPFVSAGIIALVSVGLNAFYDMGKMEGRKARKK